MISVCSGGSGAGGGVATDSPFLGFSDFFFASLPLIGLAFSLLA